MFKNYFKTAIRSLNKNKGFTALNVLGLALGLTVCLLIVFHVFDELSYDHYNTKSGRIYRVNEDLKLGDNSYFYAVCMAPLAQTLKKDFPEVEDAVRIKPLSSQHVKKGTEEILESNIAYVDASLFDVFTLPMLEGSSHNALASPNSVVLTASTAKKYFSSIQVVGKTLSIGDYPNLKITGVIADLPKQSHFNFDFFISMATYPGSNETQWLRSVFNTYVLLRKSADAQNFEAKLPAFLAKYSASEMQSALKQSLGTFQKNGNYFRLNLIPLTSIHLHSKRLGELGQNSTPQYVYIFSAIAIFILLIACVNFINLSTARSANRAREVGVRKVLGSPRKYLIAQFLTESVLVTFLATIIALVAAWALLPVFNQVSGKELVLTSKIVFWLIPFLLFLIAFIGFLAGAYPAFFLSAFQPVDVLKGKLSTGFKGGKLRSFLVVFQFSVSIFLIIGTLVIYSQLHYIQTKNLGYNRKQVLIVQKVFELGSQADVFKQQVKQLPGVTNATLSWFLPTSAYRSAPLFYKDATFDPKESILPQLWSVDEDYISTLDIKMAAGRNFSRQMLTDSSGIIINQAAARLLGFGNGINKSLYRGSNPDDAKEYHIIGIVKDFNFSSLRDNIDPLFMVLERNNGSLSVRINAADATAVLAKIKATWQNLAPNQHFEYSFMDADFDATFRAEQQAGTICVIFTSLAIIIACLGLFGLAAYAAEQRTKEIGIRKVLGAGIYTIVAMLSKDFIKLVLLAIIIASPIAWFLMHQWLQDFAYRVSIQWYTVAGAALAAILIAFATISFQSVKAALANPVRSLKNQ